MRSHLAIASLSDGQNVTTTPPVTCPGETGSNFLLLTVSAAVFIVSALWSASTVVSPELIALVWLPSGVLAALLLSFPVRKWPLLLGVFACVNLGANLLAVQTLITSVVFTLANVIEELVGVFLVRRLLNGEQFSFSQPRHVFLYALFLGVVGSATSALLALSAGVHTEADISQLLFCQRWFLGSLTGLLVAGPLTHVYIERRRLREPLFDVSDKEALTCMAGIAILSILLFNQTELLRFASVFLTMMLFPFVIWAAWRMGLFASSVAVTIIAFSLSYGVSDGRTSQASTVQVSTLVWEQGLIIVVAFTCILLSSLVTERRRAGIQLVERDRFLTTMGRHLEHGLFVASRELRAFRYVSPGLERILGVSAETLTRSPEAWRRSIHPEDLSFVTQKLLRASETGSFGFRFRICPAPGVERWAQAYVAPVSESEASIGEVVGIIQDITHEKESEDALRESEDRFHQFMNHSPAVAFIKDAEGQYVYANGNFLQRFGFTWSDVIGHNDTELFPEDAPKFQADDRAVLASGKPMVLSESAHMSMGTTLWLTAKFVLRDKSGNRLLGGISFETTNEMKSREREADLRRQLEHAQRLEALGQLAGGVAHDFNNVLTVIGANADLLARLAAKKERSSVEERYLRNISTAVTRASALTQQLLTFGRKHQGTSQIVAPSEALRELTGLLNSILKSNVQLTTVVDEHCKSVFLDPNQLQQVLLNLALNALDAMPEGGMLSIAVTARHIDGPIVENGEQHLAGDYVVFDVADTGSGIPPDILPKVFEPFFTTKPAGRGTGLGLSVAYGIVRKAGGFIRVRSAPGEGTVFSVYLPEQHSVSTTAEPQGIEVTGNGEHVLVVDDEELVREATGEILLAHGYQISKAASVAEALQTLRAQPGRFALVISDIVMPERTGLQFADDLAAEFPHIPLLLISGFSRENAQSTGHPLSAFIQKPFQTTKILEVVERLIDESRVRPEKRSTVGGV